MSCLKRREEGATPNCPEEFTVTEDPLTGTPEMPAMNVWVWPLPSRKRYGAVPLLRGVGAW